MQKTQKLASVEWTEQTELSTEVAVREANRADCVFESFMEQVDRKLNAGVEVQRTKIRMLHMEQNVEKFRDLLTKVPHSDTETETRIRSLLSKHESELAQLKDQDAENSRISTSTLFRSEAERTTDQQSLQGQLSVLSEQLQVTEQQLKKERHLREMAEEEIGRLTRQLQMRSSCDWEEVLNDPDYMPSAVKNKKHPCRCQGTCDSRLCLCFRNGTPCSISNTRKCFCDPDKCYNIRSMPMRNSESSVITRLRRKQSNFNL
ncbi:hypothetical protein Ciccas_011930 [Cichlidogyrus casuarinus]|uniref:Tesmin/TSO1-like CXC domain-containing protein n=1 Tax=Cichlidogyrus casuarinus TaxID=1844966 RepID=A0ABD2PSW0_9PLAT